MKIPSSPKCIRAAERSLNRQRFHEASTCFFFHLSAWKEIQVIYKKKRKFRTFLARTDHMINANKLSARGYKVANLRHEALEGTLGNMVSINSTMIRHHGGAGYSPCVG
jgi:hypothetical protein